jgi:hypothetical protein
VAIAGAAVVASPSTARAEEPAETAEAELPFAAPPPYAPFKRGPFVEGSVGVYGPTGRIKTVSAPGPWARISAGFDFTRWVGAYVMFDSAFLDTGRGSPPPDPRGYALWGFGLGARLSLGLGDRFRIPFRLELSWHKTDDNGVLATYGFNDASSFNVSFGGATGIEWRAPTRHFGVAAEIGLRNDSALAHSQRAQSPLAIIGALVVRYTL